MLSLRTKLEATKAKLESQDFTNLTKDDLLGDLLYTTALSYHAELGVMNFVSAKTMGVMAITLPSETIFSFELKRNFAFGIPISVSSGGLAMDADRLYSLVKSLDGNAEKPKQFFLSSGMNGSALEHSVPEQLFSTPENPAEGISAVKALQLANEQGIPIYTINQTNINSILPQLQVDGDVKADIQNAVNAGKEVTVSKTNINFNGWNGCGYIIIDPTTGAGAYMISGGINGAVIMTFVGASMIIAGVASGPVGIILLAYGFLLFLTGVFWYYSELTNQEQDDFLCAVKVLTTIEFSILSFHFLPLLPLLAKIAVGIKIIGWVTKIKKLFDFVGCFKH